jgi:hypothetical protein
VAPGHLRSTRLGNDGDKLDVAEIAGITIAVFALLSIIAIYAALQYIQIHKKNAVEVTTKEQQLQKGPVKASKKEQRWPFRSTFSRSKVAAADATTQVVEMNQEKVTAPVTAPVLTACSPPPLGLSTQLEEGPAKASKKEQRWTFRSTFSWKKGAAADVTQVNRQEDVTAPASTAPPATAPVTAPVTTSVTSPAQHGSPLPPLDLVTAKMGKQPNATGRRPTMEKGGPLSPITGMNGPAATATAATATATATAATTTARKGPPAVEGLVACESALK